MEALPNLLTLLVVTSLMTLLVVTQRLSLQAVSQSLSLQAVSQTGKKPMQMLLLEPDRPLQIRMHVRSVIPDEQL